LIGHLEKKRDAEAAKVKTPAAKQSKIDSHNAIIADIQKHSEGLHHALEMHGHIQKAKDTLIKAMGNPSDFEFSVGGRTVKPEGFVVIKNGRPSKLVDRAEFSRLNFANNRGRGDPEAVTPPPEEKHHVFAFGRMNPPTVGHGALVDKVKELAKTNNADHSIVLSHSQDPEKNPLTAEQKLKHAKRFFPGTNLSVATKEAPTFIHHLKKLHQQGITHLTMVAGGDRVPEYKKLIDKYNGPGKEFNFKQVNVVSAGERDPDAEGVTGMSASKMRAHAAANNFSWFKKGIPQHVKPEHAEELYNDVKAGMSAPKPEKKKAVKKVVKEENTVSNLTYDLSKVDPGGEALQAYHVSNIESGDTKNDILDRQLEKWGLKRFKEYRNGPIQKR
jgi:hypothetical protein